MTASDLPARVLRRVRRAWLGLAPKQFNEREYWREELASIVAWHEGRVPHLWGEPPPGPDEQVRGHGKAADAALAWAARGARTARYPSRLFLAPDAFHGLRVLEIGCGPAAPVLAFTGCEIVGVDPFVGVYRALGYPLDQYDARLTYCQAPAEAIPVPDASFDAVISVNAIDHVDDIQAAAHEVQRVLKPGGWFQMEIHYHAATSCEPVELDDARVAALFGSTGAVKVAERPISATNPFLTSSEPVTVWSSRPERCRTA